jgi:hypothetical protein
VISLLRHPPYMRTAGVLPEWERTQGIPYNTLCDWKDETGKRERGDVDDCGVKMCTELHDYEFTIPHIFGLIIGGRNAEVIIIIDTQHGVIYSPGSDETIQNEEKLWTSEEEAHWRGHATAWRTEDFFEILEEQFRNLRFIPVNARQVLAKVGEDEMVARLCGIYREHEWPDLKTHQKKESIEEGEKVTLEEYPGFGY